MTDRRGMSRMTVTLLSGAVLGVGDRCLALIYQRWRRAIVCEIAQGTGVERAWVNLSNGEKFGPISRYYLRSAA